MVRLKSSTRAILKTVAKRRDLAQSHAGRRELAGRLKTMRSKPGGKWAAKSAYTTGRIASAGHGY